MSKFDQIIEKQELNLARGLGRKHLFQVPDSVRTKPFKVGYTPKSKQSLGLNKNAKANTKVLQTISQPQAIDMAKKYNTNLPTQNDRKTKLGSTGITLAWVAPGRFRMTKGVN